MLIAPDLTLASSSAQTAGLESKPWMRTAMWERSLRPSLTPRVRSWNTGLGSSCQYGIQVVQLGEQWGAAVSGKEIKAPCLMSFQQLGRSSVAATFTSCTCPARWSATPLAKWSATPLVLKLPAIPLVRGLKGADREAEHSSREKTERRFFTNSFIISSTWKNHYRNNFTAFLL